MYIYFWLGKLYKTYLFWQVNIIVMAKKDYLLWQTKINVMANTSNLVWQTSLHQNEVFIAIHTTNNSYFFLFSNLILTIHTAYDIY